eukprot:1270560-Pleurochrysis_carterae.AAC.3
MVITLAASNFASLTLPQLLNRIRGRRELVSVLIGKGAPPQFSQLVNAKRQALLGRGLGWCDGIKICLDASRPCVLVTLTPAAAISSSTL